MISSRHHLHLLVIMIMSSTELDASFNFLMIPLYLWSFQYIEPCQLYQLARHLVVIFEDIVMLEPGPGIGPHWEGHLTPGVWPRSGQLPRPALQDGPGWPGLAWGLPWLGSLLLRVRLLSDQGGLGAGHHLQGLQWREQRAGSATKVGIMSSSLLTVVSSLDRTLQAELAERNAGNEAAGDELLGVEGEEVLEC